MFDQKYVAQGRVQPPKKYVTFRPMLDLTPLTPKENYKPESRYDAHCAPLVYHYFRPTHVIGGEEHCFWESKSSKKLVMGQKICVVSEHPLHPKPAIGKVL